MSNLKKRNLSFIFGGITAVIFVILGIIIGARTSLWGFLGVFAVLSVLGFTFVSCLFLNNNTVGELVVDIFLIGFVRWPGLIFTLDLDGIIWLLTVKLLFWILGFALAILFGLLGVLAGALISLFVYPFALRKNIMNKQV